MDDEPQAEEPRPPLPKRRADSPDAQDTSDSEITSGREAYNVVSDTVTGVNFRLSDNCFQAVFIFVSVILGAGVGAFFAFPEGVIIGAFIGLVGGLLLSGAVLMVFRATRHLKGKHE